MGESRFCIKDFPFKAIPKHSSLSIRSPVINCTVWIGHRFSVPMCYLGGMYTYALPNHYGEIEIIYSSLIFIFEFAAIKDFSLYFRICSSEWPKREENKYSLD